MLAKIACFATAVFFSLILASATQPLASLGESCARLQCAKNLKCSPTNTGKRCLQVIPLDGKCGGENTTCYYGTRCVRDPVSDEQTCMEELARGAACALPSENMQTVAVCEQGKNLVCEFQEDIFTYFSRKYCIKVVQPGERCELNYERCPRGQACVFTAAGQRCQKLPEAGIGAKCYSSAAGPGKSTALAVCKHPRFKLVCAFAKNQYTFRRCLKLGSEGENCDNDWRHCDYGLMCLRDTKTKRRVCQSSQVTAGFGQECGSRHDEFSGFAKCKSGLRCIPVLSEYRKARCWAQNGPGKSCAGKLQGCVEGYTCNASKTCVKQPEADVGVPCGDFWDLDSISRKCKSGLRCKYPLVDGSKRCVAAVASGDACDKFRRCFGKHQCIKYGTSERAICQPIAKLGEDCSDKTCECLNFIQKSGECEIRALCMKTEAGFRCSKRNLSADPVVCRPRTRF